MLLNGILVHRSLLDQHLTRASLGCSSKNDCFASRKALAGGSCEHLLQLSHNTGTAPRQTSPSMGLTVEGSLEAGDAR